MRPGLPLIAAALDDVPQMGNHAGGRNRLAPVVEVDAPGIARAFGKHFKHVPRGMIAPDARVERDALAVRRARLADTSEYVNTPWQP